MTATFRRACVSSAALAAAALMAARARIALGAFGEPRLSTPVEVFSAGFGYPNYRTPSITATADGSLIAIAEGRTFDDPGIGSSDLDIVCRRSTDGGATWSLMQTIDAWSGGSCSNPTTVLDRSNNRLWLLYDRWEGTHGTTDSQPGTTNNTAWARYSDDNGQTWSSPTDITATTKDVANWPTISFGPGSGIQASNGRLIIPSARWFNGWNTYAVYSSDHGSTWTRGVLTPGGNLAGENQLVQLSDGKILMDARPNTLGAPRLVSTSSNGGLSWTIPASAQTNPDCEVAIERWTLQSAGDDLNRIVRTGPLGPDRVDLTARISYDEGQTYANGPLLHDGYSGYSDLTILQNGSAGVLYETNEARSLTFAKFNRFWLEPPQGLKGLESFRYNTATLDTKNGGLLFASGWRGGGAALTGAPTAKIEKSDLQYTNFPFAIEGQRRAYFKAGGNMSRALPTPIDLAGNQPSYFSMLIREDAVGTTETEGASEALDIGLFSGTTRVISFGVHGNESFYFELPGQGGATTADALDKNAVYYLVAKVVPGATDQIYLKAFRTGDAVPANDDNLGWTLAGTAGANSSALLDRLVIQGGSQTDWLVDEFRYGTTFGAVVSNVARYKWNIDNGGSWSLAPNWVDDSPNLPNVVAEFTNAITSPRTISITGTQTVGGIVFDNANRYTLSASGAGTLVLDTTGAPGSVSVRSGSHTIAVPLVLAKDTTIDVAPATSVLTISSSIEASSISITKTGAGRVDLPRVRAQGLTINAGIVSLAPSGGASSLALLSISPGATLDLTDNDLILTSTAKSSVESHVASKRLTSSLATPTSSTALGVLDGADYLAFGNPNFDGEPVSPTDVLVKYTWNGDATFDGRITFDDYVRIDTGFNSQLTGWANGDFNYDGAVNFDDYVLIDIAFNAQNGTLSRAVDWISGDDRSRSGRTVTGVELAIAHFDQFGPAYGAAFLAHVPEPFAVFPLTAIAFLRRMLRRSPSRIRQDSR